MGKYAEPLKHTLISHSRACSKLSMLWTQVTLKQLKGFGRMNNFNFVQGKPLYNTYVGG